MTMIHLAYPEQYAVRELFQLGFMRAKNYPRKLDEEAGLGNKVPSRSFSRRVIGRI
jgi:hypothetical protein